jgi:hypothetical protein
MDLQDFLKQAGQKIGQVINPPTPYQPTTGDIIGSQIPEIKNGPSGFLQIVSQLARARGQAQLAKYADSLARQHEANAQANTQSEMDLRSAQIGNYANEDKYRQGELAYRDRTEQDTANRNRITDEHNLAMEKRPIVHEGQDGTIYIIDPNTGEMTAKGGKPKPPAAKNPGVRQVPDGKGGMKLEYFNEDDPATVTFSTPGFHQPPNTANQATDADVEDAVQSVLHGMSVPSMYPGFGATSLKGRVQTKLAHEYPDFNVQQAESNFTYGKSAGFQTRDRMLGAIEPTGQLLKLKAAAVANPTTWTYVNNAILNGKENLLSDPAAIQYSNALSNFSNEIAQTYGGNTSDYKNKLASSLLNSGYSQAGLEAAIQQEIDTAATRKQVLEKGTYRDGSRGAPPAAAPAAKAPPGSIMIGGKVYKVIP